MISTIINDRHAGSRVGARISNVILMTTSSLVRILSGQLMAAAPDKPVHVWIVLLSAIASVIAQASLCIAFYIYMSLYECRYILLHSALFMTNMFDLEILSVN